MLNKLQTLGKALMLPIAVLPIAGILLRLGQPDVLNLPFLAQAGGAIFGNLALIFAIGVAGGLSKDNASAAALAGAVAYLIMIEAMKTINKDINMGVLAGILAGLIGGLCYNRFYTFKTPSWLAFFSGKRFVPIISGLIALVLALLFGFIWPPIQVGINTFGTWLIGAGAIGVALYGFFNRLLLSVGLHQVLNTLVWFQFGDFTDAAGKLVHGDLNRFFALDKTAGGFMAGFFPIMMFGLPAAALAMFTMAKKNQRAIVGGVLFSVAFTAFLTGITEPIEYLFMFLAPAVYLVHAILTGISLGVSYLLGYKAGFTFSAGLIDAILSWGIATKPWLLLILGPITAAVYYVLFVTVIKVFNIKTIGRGDDEAMLATKPGEVTQSDVARNYIQALGGAQNIISIDNCVTRLRLQLKDVSKLNEEQIKKLGCQAIIKLGVNSVQLMIGTQVEFLSNDMKAVLASSEAAATSLTLMAPVAGKIVALEKVPDEGFAGRSIGDGIAIEPSDGLFCAPVAGLLTLVRQGHAFMIETDDGNEVLVHIGVNTVELNGEGFEFLAKSESRVEVGTPIIRADLAKIKAKGLSTLTPVLCTTMEKVTELKLLCKIDDAVKGQAPLFTVYNNDRK